MHRGRAAMSETKSPAVEATCDTGPAIAYQLPDNIEDDFKMDYTSDGISIFVEFELARLSSLPVSECAMREVTQRSRGFLRSLHTIYSMENLTGPPLHALRMCLGADGRDLANLAYLSLIHI